MCATCSRAWACEGRIKSPTYAVVEPYTLAAAGPDAGQNGGMNIWHFDFYRFNDPREWEEAGFRDIFAAAGLKLVEWPEKAGPHLPQPDLLLRLEVLPDDTPRRHPERPTRATGAELIA